MPMRTILPLLAVLSLLTPAAALAQAGAGTLPAFSGERELALFRDSLERARRSAAPPGALCGTAAVSQAEALPADAAAGAVLHGRVLSTDGAPQPAVAVRIEALNLGAQTGADGTYRIALPADRVEEPTDVLLSASRVGLRPQRARVALSPGDSVRADFTLCPSVLALEALVATGQGTAKAAESVTNVQHAGVDEGGIVKVHGDHLVILRRGRLFTVKVGDGELRPVAAVDAYGPGIDPGAAWYDEMLISGDVVIVLGYSYGGGGTEVNLFHVDRRGGLRHGSTWHLRSNDYYSSENYASRLVDGKLVFYTPLFLPPWGLGEMGEDTAGALSDGMPALRRWHPGAEHAGGGAALLRVAVGAFGDGSAQAPASAYRPLPVPEGYGFVNRFVGAHLLYGTGNGWGRPEGSEGDALYVVDWRRGGARRLALPHPVDRIEAMGSHAVVVGADERDLHFSAVRLGAQPRLAGRHTLPDASQGELRSHGFFYRADDHGTGLLGLPVRGSGRPGWEHLFDESASIVFVRNRHLRLVAAGELQSRPEGSIDDGCVASCVDWYGNARPLFLRGRVFALMGYELVEGRVSGGRIREVRRTSFAPRAGATASR